MSILVFDIETIPDTKTGQLLHNTPHLTASDMAEAMLALRRQETQREFLPHYLQQIVAISAVLATSDKIHVWSLGEEQSPEAELIRRFFEGIERHTPTLVSWNGSGFDLPVLHYRALYHGIVAPNYWEVGDTNSQFRYNNYLNRYHYRHLDLMDVLSAYQAKAVAPLDNIAQMLGFPGKMGMHGSEVWPAYQAGRIQDIRHYCETDVLNTYLVFLRFEWIRGKLTEANYLAQLQRLRLYLRQSDKPHLSAFEQAWQDVTKPYEETR